MRTIQCSHEQCDVLLMPFELDVYPLQWQHSGDMYCHMHEERKQFKQTPKTAVERLLVKYEKFADEEQFSSDICSMPLLWAMIEHMRAGDWTFLDIEVNRAENMQHMDPDWYRKIRWEWDRVLSAMVKDSKSVKFQLGNRVRLSKFGRENDTYAAYGNTVFRINKFYTTDDENDPHGYRLYDRATGETLYEIFNARTDKVCEFCFYDSELELVPVVTPAIKKRLEYLRGELRAERISTSELVELQGLATYIDPGDVELLEAAGVPEFSES